METHNLPNEELYNTIEDSNSTRRVNKKKNLTPFTTAYFPPDRSLSARVNFCYDCWTFG